MRSGDFLQYLTLLTAIAYCFLVHLLHDEEDEVGHVVDDPLGQRGERSRHFGGQRQSQAEGEGGHGMRIFGLDFDLIFCYLTIF